MIDWTKASAELNKKLDPANVRPAPQGKFGEYVDGYHVVSEANRIFGNGGWSYEITRLVETSRIEVKGGAQVRVSYLCTVKVHVGDSFKEGSAVGMGSGKPDNLGDVIESAVKEAETDALKRALRTYGNTFGLALYDVTRENVGADLPPLDPVAAHDRIIKRIEGAKDYDGLCDVWAAEQETVMQIGKERADLGRSLYEARNLAKENLQQKDAA